MDILSTLVHYGAAAAADALINRKFSTEICLNIKMSMLKVLRRRLLHRTTVTSAGI